MKMIFLYIVILGPTLMSCGRSDSKKSNSEKNINGLTASKGWCQVDLVADGFEVVTKINFLDDKNIRMERIRISNDESPVTYRFSKNYEYVLGTGYPEYNKYILKTVQGSESVQKLKNFNEQKTIFNIVLSKNTNLEKNVTSFSPDRAVVLKAMGLYPDTEQYFYPCDNYSSTLNKNLPVRPMVEFQIYLGQTISSMRPEGQLPITMALTLPINEVVTRPEKLMGTQWCKWLEMKSAEAPQVTILTVKDDTFRDATYPGMPDLYEQHPYTLQTIAKRAPVYTINKSSNGLKGYYEREFGDTLYKREVAYKMVEDASGVVALIEEKGESDIVSGYEILYVCDDQRPLIAYPAYAKWLKKMLDLEMSL